MATEHTIDDIWKLFQETNRLSQESERRWEKSKQEWKEKTQETERTMQENHEKTERIMKETLEKTARIMKENHEKTERSVEYTINQVSKQIDRVSKQMDRASKQIDRVSKQMGDLGGRWGEFVERLVEPACETIFKQRGILVQRVSRRVMAKLPGNRHMEIDLVVENTDKVALVEVKSKLTIDDVRNHLTRIPESKDFFPRFADYQIYGAVAGVVIDENVVRYAMNQGLFVIVQSGEVVKIANEPAFEPKVW